ncbi:MAG TPA: hypothetical protein VEL28_00760, partial [Candidatus Binatia bacterium]|nr:hypothetical protein [Candidatus Binatia bacterium]
SVALVYVASSPDDDPSDDEPVAELNYGGVYFFLYPDILHLQGKTGELIDAQVSAFFAGSALDALSSFVVDARVRASLQPAEWDQRVGVQGDKPWFMRTRRAEVLELLDRISAAVGKARQADVGVLFEGE